MQSFLVISAHSGDECSKVLQDVLATGYLTHFDWGCMDGEHTGWAVIEAESKREALLVVPPYARGRARVVQITKFTPEEVKGIHTTK